MKHTIFSGCLMVSLLLSITSAANCQDTPFAPSDKQSMPSSTAGSTFWSKRINVAGLVFSASGIALDALSTQRVLGQPGGFEYNPLAKPLVTTRAGGAVAGALGLGAELAGLRIAHRHQWHKLEHWAPWIVGGIEFSLAASNYHTANRIQEYARRYKR